MVSDFNENYNFLRFQGFHIFPRELVFNRNYRACDFLGGGSGPHAHAAHLGSRMPDNSFVLIWVQTI